MKPEVPSEEATLAGKSVLVTGANRGLGQALVEEALRRGAKRVYAGTRQLFSHPDPRVTPMILDVTDETQIRQAVERVESLDVLINNAGLAVYDDLGDRVVLEQHLEVNLFDLQGGVLVAVSVAPGAIGAARGQRPRRAGRPDEHRDVARLPRPEGIHRVSRASDPRRGARRRGRHLPRSDVSDPGGELADRGSQADGAPERGAGGAGAERGVRSERQ
jgi:NAD(P)-dependent dehydrogenase (short-subunit alcohol dehydrogenase family)